MSQVQEVSDRVRDTVEPSDGEKAVRRCAGEAHEKSKQGSKWLGCLKRVSDVLNGTTSEGSKMPAKWS